MLNPDPYRMAPPMLELFILCKTLGQLPYEGGIMQQPNKIIEAFLIIIEALSQKNAIDPSRQHWM